MLSAQEHRIVEAGRELRRSTRPAPRRRAGAAKPGCPGPVVLSVSKDGDSTPPWATCSGLWPSPQRGVSLAHQALCFVTIDSLLLTQFYLTPAVTEGCDITHVSDDIQGCWPVYENGWIEHSSVIKGGQRSMEQKSCIRRLIAGLAGSAWSMFSALTARNCVKSRYSAYSLPREEEGRKRGPRQEIHISQSLCIDTWEWEWIAIISGFWPSDFYSLKAWQLTTK